MRKLLVSLALAGSMTFGLIGTTGTASATSVKCHHHVIVDGHKLKVCLPRYR